MLLFSFLVLQDRSLFSFFGKLAKNLFLEKSPTAKALIWSDTKISGRLSPASFVKSRESISWRRSSSLNRPADAITRLAPPPPCRLRHSAYQSPSKAPLELWLFPAAIYPLGEGRKWAALCGDDDLFSTNWYHWNVAASSALPPGWRITWCNSKRIFHRPIEIPMGDKVFLLHRGSYSERVPGGDGSMMDQNSRIDDSFIHRCQKSYQTKCAPLFMFPIFSSFFKLSILYVYMYLYIYSRSKWYGTRGTHVAQIS